MQSESINKSSLPAKWHDGTQSHAHPVTLRLEAGHLCIDHAYGTQKYRLGDITIQAELGSLARRIDLPDGGQIEVADRQGFRLLMGEERGWLQRLESGKRWIALSLIILMASAFVTYRWGLPWVADRAADVVDANTEASLGREVLEAVDEDWVKPSKLSAQRQTELLRRFAELAGKDANHYRLEFRAAPEIGPNAFALPGGTIVLTDELVALTKDDREVMAVLAHEMGHVNYRHSIRGLMRAAGLSAATAMLTGEVASLGSVLASAPVLVAQLKYNRDFENEADDFALQMLPRRNISPCYFSTAMGRLEGWYQRKAGKQDGIPSWLSTHPETDDRIVPFQRFCQK